MLDLKEIKKNNRINMKHIKPYKIFESNSPNFPTTREEVIQVCEKYEIENYTINDDLSIDVDDNVHLGFKMLEYLPLKFNYVSGGFGCYENKLISLEGSPQILDGSFLCFENELKSLEGSPSVVNGNFICSNNELKSLKGCPQTVSGSFFCNDNELKTLEGCPQTVSGSFFCSDNELKTLEGSPQTVDGDFDCFNNNLVSLEGSPKVVGGDFNCSRNELKDLEYFSEVSGDINIRYNTVNLLTYTFIDKADSFMIEDFNDYEIVRNGDTVMLDRLKEFIRGHDLEMPDLEDIKNHYKIIE